MRLVVFIFLFSLVGLTYGQQKVVLTKNFKFKDGVYLDFDAFKINRPSYKWDTLSMNIFINPQTSIAQAERIELRDSTEKKFNLDDIWGICIEGIPYIRLPKDALDKSLTTFAAIKLRGKICYFSYEKKEMKQIEMSAFNPLTGLPFRSMNVEREVDVLYEKIFLFETGEVKDFTVDNFKDWILGDQRLLNTVEGLKAEEVDEKLFKCLLIYDDRNAVSINSSKTE